MLHTVNQMRKPKITIIGSINMDLVTITDEVAMQGETVHGKDFQTLYGGKGANQAIAAARLGADVYMIGKVGDDDFGRGMLENFEAHGVDTGGIGIEKDTPSGIANIIVSDKDNRIIIISGANGKVDRAHVDRSVEIIRESDIVLVQFEIPMETVEHAIDICRRENVPIIINPAPVTELEDAYFEASAYITPNEHERAKLFKMRDDGLPGHHEKLITTQGPKGASYFKNGKEITLPPKSVEVVDTTGAGDTFNAAFAVAIAEGKDIETAINFANAAAGIAVGKIGAQNGMPKREELE